MNVLIICPGSDTGGQAIRIKQAFDRRPDSGITVRTVRKANEYLNYPADAGWDALPALYEWADVVQFQATARDYGWLDCGSRKPVVVHHQGSRLRDNSAAVVAEVESIGASQIVSTVDLLECVPEGTPWLPSPYDPAFLARYASPRRRITIAHAPTNRTVKGTDAVIRAVASLEVDFDLIENREWRVCLSRKGRANIFIDQLYLGYGNNAVEAWGMGIPVVAGVSSEAVRTRMLRMWGGIPFVEATEGTLADVLDMLIHSAEARMAAGDVGIEHFMRWHDETVAVEMLKEIWANAKPSHGAEHLRVAERRAA